jgi:hypothetical protein
MGAALQPVARIQQFERAPETAVSFAFAFLDRGNARLLMAEEIRLLRSR